jgi:hypothetical protein
LGRVKLLKRIKWFSERQNGECESIKNKDLTQDSKTELPSFDSQEKQVWLNWSKEAHSMLDGGSLSNRTDNSRLSESGNGNSVLPLISFSD